MFNRTRLHLMLRHALLFFVILFLLNAAVYFFMRTMLFSRVDQALALLPETFRSYESLQDSWVFSGPNQLDRPFLQMIWVDGKSWFPDAMTAKYSPEQLEKFNPSMLKNRIETVRLQGVSFRVITFSTASLPLQFTIENRPVTEIQWVANVSVETDILRKLRFILLFGTAAGLLISIVAGAYLAKRALIPIRQSWLRQQQFVSDASHELRTPITVIQAHSEILLRHPGHSIEQDSRHIHAVMQEARRMKKLVHHLLTLARADSNQILLERKPVVLNRLIRETMDNLEPLVAQQGLKLIPSGDDSDSGPVHPFKGDEDRLQQLLNILLDNAIKYTPSGGKITVWSGFTATAARIEVEDTGIGIAREELPRIFDRFYRVDKSRNRQEGSTGLGLSIAKWIAEAHGGRIEAMSEPGKGTKIVVELPLKFF